MIRRSRQKLRSKEGQIDSEKLLTSCVLYSVKTYVDMPYGVGQVSLKRDAMCNAIVLDNGTELVNL